jgi:hypothetical protein
MSLIEQMQQMGSAIADKGEALGPIEFWLNRYQTFIGAMIALGAAVYTLKAQSSQRFYEFLRQRSEQLHRELTLLQGLSSAVEIAIRAIVDISHTVGQNPTLNPQDRARLEGADQHLADSIKVFRDGIGPAWGDVRTQANRLDILDDAYRISLRFSRMLGESALGSAIMSPPFQEALSDLVPLQNNLARNTADFWNGIREESARIAPLIAKLEQRLLK